MIVASPELFIAAAAQRIRFGSGAMLVIGEDWSSPENMSKSFDLIERHVIAKFCGRNERRVASYDWIGDNRERFRAAAQTPPGCDREARGTGLKPLAAGLEHAAAPAMPSLARVARPEGPSRAVRTVFAITACAAAPARARRSARGPSARRAGRRTG